MVRLFSLVVVLILGLSVQAQLTIDNTMTPTQYVQNVLIGPGVTVSNVTYSGGTGTNQQIGKFTDATSNIGFSSGVVLSTGRTSTLPGNAGTLYSEGLGGPGDPDIELLPGVNGSTFDAAKLEFDFVPTSTTVSFRFVFGSDEYPEFVNSINDAFGFFVSGPGISGPYSAPGAFPNGSDNLAIIPGTSDPVSINTIYPTSVDGIGSHPELYIDNSGGTINKLDGFTVPIMITFNVFCDSTYHFKFSVADVSDGIYNTAVFLEANSFTSPPVQLSVDSGAGNTQLIEGCPSDSAIVYFTRSVCSTALPFTVNYTLSGTATDNVDYTGLSGSITIPAGEDSVFAVVHSIADAITEGTEYIIITYTYLNGNGEEITQTLTLEIIEQQPIVVNAGPDITLRCEGLSTAITPTITGAFPPYTINWNTGQSTPSINTGPLDNGVYTYIVSATGGCPSVTDSDTILVTMNQTLSIDSLVQYPASACENDGAVQAFTSGYASGGQPYNHWEGIGGSPAIDATVMQDLGAGFYVFTITDIYCTVKDTIELEQTPPPSAAINATPTSGCSPLTVQLENNSQNATTYFWNFGNGQTLNANNTGTQSQTYTDDAVVMLVASNNGSCPDTAYVTIAIATCGCTDPLAVNYDPLATVSTLTCIYPEPAVVVPNVFTPDGDGVNDVFFLQTVNATNIEYTIFNRWGGEVFSAKGLNPSPIWNGKYTDGSEAPEGVYFYTYVVEGIKSKLEGQGFVELFRK